MTDRRQEEEGCHGVGTGEDGPACIQGAVWTGPGGGGGSASVKLEAPLPDFTG
ncbi:hypothetical protein [Paenibacillus sp. GM2]|uniref:hypothetical protein n=1 Tax=Paenibacillus sp. GM2 TaxID=1622070 RepID=UPI0012FAF1A6|nr:hypothetical protein [Paenibacillus sp. GM2]